MSDKVVDFKGQARETPGKSVPDVWYAHVDIRLTRIEVLIARLEWQIWIIVCGIVALFVLAILQSLSPV